MMMKRGHITRIGGTCNTQVRKGVTGGRRMQILKSQIKGKEIKYRRKTKRIRQIRMGGTDREGEV